MAILTRRTEIRTKAPTFKSLRRMVPQRTRALAFSMRTTKETVHANVYNRAFTAAFTGGDGATLCSTSHPTRSGDQANRPAVDVDFSEAALEDMLTQIRDAKNNRGLPIPIRGEKLIIPTALEWECERVLMSTLQSGTANNDINAMRSRGVLPGGKIINTYLTDSDAWFVYTNCPDGMIAFDRYSEGPSQDNDFDTMNLRVKRYELYDMGWGDFRGLYGSPGA